MSLNIIANRMFAVFNGYVSMQYFKQIRILSTIKLYILYQKQ